MDFVPGEVYRRRDLHQRYGGQEQSGIITPRRHPMVLLVTGRSGEAYGYRDGPRPDGTFWYAGQGQVGDMRMHLGNRAVRDHQADGKALHLFEDLDDGHLRYVGEATYVGHHEEQAPDRNGDPRTAIVFELTLDSPADGTQHPDVREAPRASPEERTMWRRPLAELRRLAETTAPMGAPSRERRANAYERSEAVRVYVLRRADGVCEGCGAPAPFTTTAGRPYLEPHHIRRRADGGPDHPRWVAGVCPNCHRRAHYASDGHRFNEALAETVGRLEADDAG